MRITQVSIFGLMALVLVAALDFGLVKAVFEINHGRPQLTDLVCFGGLPMANILGLGAVLLVQSRLQTGRWRAGLGGFEALGGVAFLVFATLALLATDWLHDGVRDLLLRVGIQPGLGMVSCALILFLVPQLALGGLGAWLGRITRGPAGKLDGLEAT